MANSISPRLGTSQKGAPSLITATCYMLIFKFDCWQVLTKSKMQGKYNPSLRLAHNVASALGATIDEIFILESLEEAGKS